MPRRKGNARDDGSPYENMQTEDQWGGPPVAEEEFDAIYAEIRSYRRPDKPAGECPPPTDG